MTLNYRVFFISILELSFNSILSVLFISIKTYETYVVGTLQFFHRNGPEPILKHSQFSTIYTVNSLLYYPSHRIDVDDLTHFGQRINPRIIMHLQCMHTSTETRRKQVTIIRRSRKCNRPFFMTIYHKQQ